MTNKKMLFKTAGISVILALTCNSPLVSAQQEFNGKPPAGFNEWNMPRDLYIPGDPLLINEENIGSGQRISFVSCPYVRDSVPTPLWLTDYEGETYFLRAQQNTTANVRHPQLKHKVLVEGVISDEPRIAGGIVLNPLQLSVLPDVDISCDTILPADGSRVEFSRRPPGPGGSGAGRVANDQKRRAFAQRLWADEYTPDPVDNPEVKTYEIRFEFEGSIVTIPDYANILRMVKYARDVDAKRIQITGQRGSVLLSDGTTITESEATTAKRVDAVERIFRDHPFAADVIQTRVKPTPVEANGITDFANRTVTITIKPGAS